MHLATQVTTKDKFPWIKHWAIIEFSQVHHEGDQRSRDFPGHGYGAYTEDVISYQAYTDKNEWIMKIEWMVSKGKTNYVAFEVEPAVIEVKTTVQVSSPKAR